MADVNRGNRPLSPHLSVYRMKATMLSSITHRITGSALMLAAELVVWWYLAAATAPEYFATADAVLNSWIGGLVLIGSLWALMYHLVNGIRHLIWDMALGLDKDVATRSSYYVWGGSVVLTVLVLLVM